MPAESTLVILMPETEALVRVFRDRYDRAAARGMPAHVTLLYPFKPPSELSQTLIESLTHLFSQSRGFEVTFAQTRRFPDVLYLAPEPAQPFRDLVSMLSRQFPENPPYGGAFGDVIPHLTVAQLADPDQLDRIAAEFEGAAQNQLPIQVNVSTVTLLENGSGDWRVHTRFSLCP